MKSEFLGIFFFNKDFKILNVIGEYAMHIKRNKADNNKELIILGFSAFLYNVINN